MLELPRKGDGNYKIPVGNDEVDVVYWVNLWRWKKSVAVGWNCVEGVDGTEEEKERSEGEAKEVKDEKKEGAPEAGRKPRRNWLWFGNCGM